MRAIGASAKRPSGNRRQRKLRKRRAKGVGVARKNGIDQQEAGHIPRNGMIDLVEATKRLRRNAELEVEDEDEHQRDEKTSEMPR